MNQGEEYAIRLLELEAFPFHFLNFLRLIYF